jgi:hypothetical protein
MGREALVWVEGGSVNLGVPLHVRVAEALGCKPKTFSPVGRHPDTIGYSCACPGANRGEAHGDMLGVNRYDRDWSVTGPLVEKFCITVTDGLTAQGWMAVTWLEASQDEGARWAEEGQGETPLIAVCNLILALKEAGKLNEVA